MSLAEKMAAIYTEVDRFAKSKRIEGAGPKFAYTPVEEIADELRHVMGQHGIVMVPEHIDVLTMDEAGVTSSGSTRWRAVLQVRWSITDGTDELQVTSIGEAIDTGDKSMNKAQTAARKYALIGAFQLSTGEDTDRRHPEQEDRSRRPAAKPAPAPTQTSTSISQARWEQLVGLAEPGTEADLKEHLKGLEITRKADLVDDEKFDLAKSGARTVSKNAKTGKRQHPEASGTGPVQAEELFDGSATPVAPAMGKGKV